MYKILIAAGVIILSSCGNSQQLTSSSYDNASIVRQSSQTSEDNKAGEMREAELGGVKVKFETPANQDNSVKKGQFGQ